MTAHRAVIFAIAQFSCKTRYCTIISTEYTLIEKVRKNMENRNRYLSVCIARSGYDRLYYSY